jgi:glutathione S-transferase
MSYIHIIAVLAVLQFFMFGILVGRARKKYAVRAPSISGNEHFERALRVQMNTLEQLAGFLPALFISAQYWPPKTVALVGVVYIVGRLIYWRSYLSDPSKRQLGFLMTVIPTFILLAVSLVGAALHI